MREARKFLSRCFDDAIPTPTKRSGQLMVFNRFDMVSAGMRIPIQNLIQEFECVGRYLGSVPRIGCFLRNGDWRTQQNEQYENGTNPSDFDLKLFDHVSFAIGDRVASKSYYSGYYPTSEPPT